MTTSGLQPELPEGWEDVVARAYSVFGEGLEQGAAPLPVGWQLQLTDAYRAFGFFDRISSEARSAWSKANYKAGKYLIDPKTKRFMEKPDVRGDLDGSSSAGPRGRLASAPLPREPRPRLDAYEAWQRDYTKWYAAHYGLDLPERPQPGQMLPGQLDAWNRMHDDWMARYREWYAANIHHWRPEVPERAPEPVVDPESRPVVPQKPTPVLVDPPNPSPVPGGTPQRLPKDEWNTPGRVPGVNGEWVPNYGGGMTWVPYDSSAPLPQRPQRPMIPRKPGAGGPQGGLAEETPLTPAPGAPGAPAWNGKDAHPDWDLESGSIPGIPDGDKGADLADEARDAYKQMLEARKKWREKFNRLNDLKNCRKDPDCMARRKKQDAEARERDPWRDSVDSIDDDIVNAEKEAREANAAFGGRRKEMRAALEELAEERGVPKEGRWWLHDMTKGQEQALFALLEKRERERARNLPKPEQVHHPAVGGEQGGKSGPAYRLERDADGNLVVYDRDGKRVEKADAIDHESNAMFLSDGPDRVMVYIEGPNAGKYYPLDLDLGAVPVDWANWSAVVGGPRYKLGKDADGNMVVYDRNGKRLERAEDPGLDDAAMFVHDEDGSIKAMVFLEGKEAGKYRPVDLKLDVPGDVVPAGGKWNDKEAHPGWEVSDPMAIPGFPRADPVSVDAGERLLREDAAAAHKKFVDLRQKWKEERKAAAVKGWGSTPEMQRLNSAMGRARNEMRLALDMLAIDLQVPRENWWWR